MTSATPTSKVASAPRDWDPEEVVATSWAVIAACGWTPITSDSYARRATRLLVHAALADDPAVGDHHGAIANCLPAGRARASAIITAILRIVDSDGLVGALRLAALSADRVDPDHLAPVVTAVATQIGRAHRRGLATPTPGRHQSDTGPVGQLWDRITVTGIVTGVRSIRGFVGGTHNTRLLLDCGDFGVKLISGRAWSSAVELGDEITVSGEVRGHEDWHGWPATVLSDTQPVALPTDESSNHSRQARVRHRFPDATQQASSTVARRTAS
jgi:hypothetical protein